MAADQWVQVVRQQVALGRLLPLGQLPDGVWIAERAAVRSLREAAGTLAEVGTGRIRLELADPAAAFPEPVVPAPPSALGPGPLRVSVECLAAARTPLPELAERLRQVLLRAAWERLGLEVTGVDILVTGLADVPAEPDTPQSVDTHPGPPTPAGDTEKDPVAQAVRAVPGVIRLASCLGPLGRPLRTVEDHRLVQVVVSGDRRTLDVARQVRETASQASGDAVTVAVLVTDIE